MLRLVNNFNKTLQITAEPLSNLECVRWRRKPRWLPTAKSKVFRVPARPIVPDVEREEIKRLYNNYRTHIKSIRRYLTKQYEMASRRTVDPKMLQEAFDKDFAESNAINDSWNAENAKLREARYKENVAKELEIAAERQIVRKQILEQRFEAAEKLVQEQKAISHTFITEANIDQAIEKALGSVVDHNFAIDKEGNKLIGRDTKPSKEVNKTEEPVEVKQ